MAIQIERFKNWLLRRSPHSATHIHYARDVALFFRWAKKPISDITLFDIDAYIAHCQDELDHVPATINRRLAAVRSLYEFLGLESDDAPPNPVIPKRHFVKQGRPLPRDAKEDDIERLFAVIRSTRDRAIFLLMLRCGLRVGEVHALSLNNLYLQPSPGSLPRLRVVGKQHNERVVFVSNDALTVLQRWLAERPRVASDALFVTSSGSRLKVNSIQVALIRYCRKAGVHISCHQFRHTFGRHLVEADVPITTIQRLLGHAHYSTTERYLHVSPNKLQADYEAAIDQVCQRLSLDEEVGQ